MMQGFAAMSFLFFTVGLFWHPLLKFPVCLLFLYGLTFFFANYGPNTTTFILPSLVYSAECRSTFNGVSAACGKLGALVGASVFAPLDRKFNEKVIMFMCAGTALVAFAMTARFVRLRATPVRIPEPGRGRYSVAMPPMS
jgi:PHS family inorganic phosphate transporter-like MFS transporter